MPHSWQEVHVLLAGLVRDSYRLAEELASCGEVLGQGRQGVHIVLTTILAPFPDLDTASEFTVHAARCLPMQHQLKALGSAPAACWGQNGDNIGHAKLR